MEAQQAIDTVTASLERCAETRGDIVPEVYDRFFALNTEARELMGHSDEYLRGRMFEEVLNLLMSDEAFGHDGYLDWELDNHLLAYSATREMYVAFFAAVLEVVRESAGDGWTSQQADAWQSRIDLIMARVEGHRHR